MAKLKNSILKDIRSAARSIRIEEESSNPKPKHSKQLSVSQKRQIRNESLDNQRVKVTWNIHPGDLVKIKSHASPTGRELFGLVTWGIKQTIHQAPSYKKDLKSYKNNVRVMSSAGYLFFPANSMIVIS